YPAGSVRESRRSRSERGQIAVLIAGFFVVVGLLTVVVVDASVAYLRNQSLNALADGAALAAADGIEEEQVYRGDLDDRADIDRKLAQKYVDQYLEDVGAYAEYDGLQFDVDPGDESVVVKVWAPADLPIRPPG